MVKKSVILQMPCQFNNVSVGEKTASISCSVDRSRLKVTVADRNLVGRRLEVKLLGIPRGDEPEQKRMFDDAEQLDGVMDVNGFTCRLKQLSFTASFKLAEINVTTLCAFAKKSGRIDVYSVGKIPDDEDGDEEEEEEPTADGDEDGKPRARKARGDDDL